jgi:hypothetical protein
MRLTLLRVVESVLAILFVGLYVALAAKTWGGFFFIHNLVIVGIPLFLGYFLLVIMARQHIEKRRGRNRAPAKPSPIPEDGLAD